MSRWWMDFDFRKCTLGDIVPAMPSIPTVEEVVESLDAVGENLAEFADILTDPWEDDDVDRMYLDSESIGEQ